MNPVAFEAPLALAGLALVALPVVIHALARRAPRELALPTVRFLDGAPRARRRLSTPQDLLVLAFRALAIAAFAVAAARPFLPDAARGSTPGDLVLVVDDTLSMSHGMAHGMAHGREKSRFERARERGLAALEGLGPSGRVALATTTAPRAAWESPGQARARLAALAPSDRTGSLVPALEAAAALVQGGRARVVVLSDLDRAALEGLEGRSAPARALALEVVDVGGDPARNAFLVDVDLSPRPPVAGDVVTVTARVRAVGIPDSEELTVAVERGGRTLAEKRAHPGELVRFELPPAPEGVLAGELVVRSQEDQLAADDRAGFAASVLGTLRVLVAGRETGSKGAQGREQPVLGALAALATSTGVKLQVDVVSEEDLAKGVPERTSVLVLAAPGELGAPARTAVAQHVARGGGLLVLLDERPPAETLRALARAGALPATAAEAAVAVPGTTRGTAGSFDPAVARALGGLLLAPQAALAPERDARVVLTGERGDALWVERGRSCVLGFAPVGRNAALAAEAAFPLLVRRALRGALGRDRSPPVEVGEALSLDELARASGCRATDLEGGTVLAPDGKVGPVTRALLPLACGVHRVRAPSGEDLAAFAAHAPARESALERAPEPLRATLAGASPVHATRGARSLAEPIAALGLALLALSSLLANRGLWRSLRAVPTPPRRVPEGARS